MIRDFKVLEIMLNEERDRELRQLASQVFWSILLLPKKHHKKIKAQAMSNKAEILSKFGQENKSQ